MNKLKVVDQYIVQPNSEGDVERVQGVLQVDIM